MREWHVTAGKRNEALDNRVYNAAALAGLRSLGFDLDALAAKVTAKPMKSDPFERIPATSKTPTVLRSSWMDA